MTGRQPPGRHLPQDKQSPFLPQHLSTDSSPNTPKKRSLSDSTPSLDPSPKFLESQPKKARDDDSVISTPSRAARRVDLSARGLCLQMSAAPTRDNTTTTPSTPGSGVSSFPIQPPQLDQIETNYGSPSSVLPRHSRGIDFARAATNLHHSTLAEQQSPESSPVVTQRQMFPPSRRGSNYAMAMDSPRISSISGWNWGHVGLGERGYSTRSVSSAHAMESEASTSSSDEDDDTTMTLMERDQEQIISTPQANKTDGISSVTPYETHRWPADGANNTTASSNQSPIPGSFANYRRNMFGKRHAKGIRDHPYQRHRTSSPEASIISSLAQNPGVFGQDSTMRSPPSRRESLSLGIGAALHITSSNEDGEESQSGKAASAPPGVVRRPVTRRSNLLPKTKGFARVRAALQEENSPIDTDVRRESEVVRQVRVKDVGLMDRIGTTPSSPDLQPTSTRNMSTDSSEMSEGEAFRAKGGLNNGVIPAMDRRGSINPWRMTQGRSQTPPPFSLNRHRSSSGVSEENRVDTSGTSTPPPLAPLSESMTSMPSIEPFVAPFQPPNLPTTAEMTRKINKRRRDEDFDVNSIKRRAVSPGMSVQSSPILGQSPVLNTASWPSSRPSREGSSTGGGEERPVNSSGSMHTGHVAPSPGTKRVGLQGMTDTSETLMKMSID